MSARSRYLEAISPRSGSGGEGGLSAPPPPPPPPPPGPPPMKNKAKQQYQQQQPRGDAPQAAMMPKQKQDVNATPPDGGGTKVTEPKQESNEHGPATVETEQVAAKGGSPWSPKEEIQSGNVAKFQQLLWGGSQQQQQTTTPTEQQKPKHHATVTSVGVSGVGSSVGTARTVKGGGIVNNASTNGGNVVMSPHMLPPATPPRHHGSGFPQRSTYNASHNHSTTPTGNSGSNKMTTSSASPKYKRNAPPPLTSAEFPNSSTPTAAAAAATAASSSSAKKTMITTVPAPSLILSSPGRSSARRGGNGGGGLVPTTPTLDHLGTNRGSNHLSSSKATTATMPITTTATPMSSSLRQRVGNSVTLTPLDTTFGGNVSGGGGDSNGIKTADRTNTTATSSLSSPMQSSVLPPSSTTPRSRIAALTGIFGNNVNTSNGGVSVPSPKTPGTRNTSRDTNSSGSNSNNNNNNNSLIHEAHASATVTGDGIATLTAFKRPNTKVGLVFTRQSSNHPEIAIISQVLPDSIFSRHRLSSSLTPTTTSDASGGGSGNGLEGAEVIAVNGTPVRDPRHAAELVARAVEEVRLTVKRGRVDAENEGRKDVDESEETSNSAVLTSAPLSSPMIAAKQHPLSKRQASERSQEGVELDEMGSSSVPHVTSMGEESQYSVMTEKDDQMDDGVNVEGSSTRLDTVLKEKSFNTSAEPTLDLNTRTESSKSAEIAERRRKAAQAMLLSENLVEDPIGDTAENLFDDADDDYDDEDDWNHQKMDFTSSRPDNLTDPIQIDRMREEAVEVFDDPFITASSGRNSKEELMASKVTNSNPSMALNDLALSTTPRAKATSISTAAPLSTSAADRRRQAALQMYNSSEMVPDNVDDVRLGTIDAVSPPASSKHGRDNATLSSWMKAEPLNEVGRVTSFGSSTSRARTDVTTSSVATARMGGSTRPSPQFGKGNSSLNDFSFSDVAAASALVARTQAIAGTTAPSTTDIKVSGNVFGSSPIVANESPAAQRRLQRAVERQMSADGFAGAVYGSQQDTNIGENLKSSVPQKMSPNTANPTSRNTISGTTPKSDVRTRNLDDSSEFVDDSPLDVIDSADADAVLDPILNLASDDSIVESGKGNAVDDKASADTPRSTRNSLRFGKMTRGRQRGQTAGITQTGYSQVHEEAPRKKMTSIFGVAKLIRKASSKKSKSYKKGITLEDDTNIFDPDSKVDGSQTVVSTRSPSPLSNRSPSSVSLVPKATSAPVVVQREEELAPLPMPPPLIPATRASDPFDTIPHVSDGDDGWGHSDFFKDNSFSSLPFSQDLALGCNVRVDDAFGFPTKSKSNSATGSITRNGLTVNADSDAFFDLAVNGADSWGEPSAMLPVDFTPRKNTSAAQHSKDHAENSDALSYDASEMSEVTNPTFASATAIHNALTATKPDPDGDAARRKDEHIKKMGGQLKLQQDLSEPNESAMPLLDISTGEKSDSSIEGKENQRLVGKQFRGDRGENAPTSLASTDTEPFVAQKLGDVDSNDNTRLDNDQETTTSVPRVAKSRIMAKYAKSGKVRRANESLGTIHGSPVDNNKNEPRSPPRSFGGTVSSSSVSITGSQQQEAKVPSVKKSTSQLSAEPSLGRKNEHALVSAQTSVAVQPVRNPKNAQLQPNTQQQGINPATTSSIANRRGRKSPMKQLTSTSGSVSPTRPIETRGSPKRSPTEKYGSNNRKKKVSPSVVDNPAYYSMDSRLGQIKDPIQRAGVRLLWAAAIPIQTQARRFLARQAAIRRMCAVLTIQAFVRRWLAERDLEIAIWSAIQIQSSFRGWFARDSLEDNHYCATQIQRVVRGYLATMHVFEDLYSITIVQSVVRMHLAINVAVDRLSSIIAIQSWWRGMKTRDLIEEMDYSAVAIQAHWRRYRAQMSYQFDIIDVIIVQSVARRWKTRRVLACVRLQCLARVMIAKKRFNEKMSMYVLVTRYTSATIIQARWRSYSAQMKLLHYIAATKIQARWRTYFAEEQYLLERSATKIQSCWRSYTAQVHLLVSVVNVIVIQSLWRRRAAVKLYKPLLHRIRLAKERKRQNSAIIIQSAWRGFVVYSFYLIKRYENKAATKIQASWRGYWQETTYSVMYCAIVKVQALVRGHQDRSWHVFQNNCATIIQASSRRFLVRREFHNESMVSILIAAAANSLRMRNAATRLQLWWIGELWKKKEKQAALVIERFFIYVKKEVEKEVAALKKKKKDKRRRRKMKQCDDYILERAWLGVANDDVPVASVTPPSLSVASHRPVDRKSHKKSDFRARGGVIPSVEEDVQSDVSGLTDLDFGVRNSRLKKSQKEFVEDASLEEAFRDSEVQLLKEKKSGGEVVDARRRQRVGYPRRYDR